MNRRGRFPVYGDQVITRLLLIVGSFGVAHLSLEKAEYLRFYGDNYIDSLVLDVIG